MTAVNYLGIPKVEIRRPEPKQAKIIAELSEKEVEKVMNYTDNVKFEK